MSRVGPEPVEVVCPNCHVLVSTRTEGRSTTRTHLLALLMAVFGLIPCAFCLYCTDCARNVDHYCTACDAYIDSYER